MRGFSYRALDTRDRGIIRVLWIVLLLNWGVALGKIIVGALAGNLTVLADGLHSTLDGINNCIGLVAIFAAAMPPDKDHPYGHRKFESVASMLIGGFIVLIAWEVLQNIVHTVWSHIKNTAEPHEAASVLGGGWLFVAVLLATLVINIFVAIYERRRGEALASTFLKADASHTFSDCMVTSFSLASLLTQNLAWWADPLLALGVLAFLLRAAWNIIAENLPALTDHVQLDPLEVKQVAGKAPGVHGIYGIRSHGTPTDVHLDLGIIIDKDITAEDAEKVEASVRGALQKAFPGLTLIAIHHTTSAAAQTEGLLK